MTYYISEKIMDLDASKPGFFAPLYTDPFSQENKMEDIGTGAGLAALGFWLFVASAVATGVYNSIRKRDAQHETLRRVIESGQTVDQELAEKLLSRTDLDSDMIPEILASLSNL